MARLKGLGKVKRLVAVPRSDHLQSLPERLKWLRATQKPVMTQKQLADRSGVHISKICKIEQGNLSANNMKLNTLRRLAHGLNCRVYINIKSLPSFAVEECQPLGPELPPLPERTDKASVEGRRRAGLILRSPYRKPVRKPRPAPHKATSETEHRPDAEPEATSE